MLSATFRDRTQETPHQLRACHTARGRSVGRAFTDRDSVARFASWSARLTPRATARPDAGATGAAAYPPDDECTEAAAPVSHARFDAAGATRSGALSRSRCSHTLLPSNPMGTAMSTRL